MALDFVAGCVGGCAGVLVGHPFDTVKVRLQTQDPSNPRYRGTLDCVRSLLREESVRGLYRGVTSPLAGVSVVNALVFGVYGQALRALGSADGADGLGVHALAGAAAGATQSVVCSPVELAKTRLQLQTSGAGPEANRGARYRGPLDCLRQVWASEGARGVFRGLGATLAREIPGFAAYFAAFEWLSGSESSAEPVPTWRLLLAGGLAGCMSWVVVYPVDVIKSRVQADGLVGERRYRGYWHCLQSGLSAEGPRFLTRGLSATLLRAFPTNAATFFVVTWSFRMMEQLEQPLEQLGEFREQRLQELRQAPGRVMVACKCQMERLPQCSLCASCAAANAGAGIG